MKKEKKYRIAIAVLILIILLQWVFIAVSRPRKAVKIPVSYKGKIAIVLDDWGYNLNNLPIAEEIRYPLTASVLPNLAYSKRIAEELHFRGWEIILHLPMQPREKYRLEKDTILVSSGAQEIKNIISQGLSNVVYARGVSNHMGSLATENPGTMEAVFKELKTRHLYFLDSVVSAKSVCAGMAKKAGVGFCRRDVFLDNTEEARYIRGQIYKLKLKSQRKGYAIGIGHDRKITLEVLKEVMPELEREGYKFVFVSELIKQR